MLKVLVVAGYCAFEWQTHLTSMRIYCMMDSVARDTVQQNVACIILHLPITEDAQLCYKNTHNVTTIPESITSDSIPPTATFMFSSQHATHAQTLDHLWRKVHH